MIEEREHEDESQGDEREQRESREQGEPQPPKEGPGVLRDDQGYGGQDSA